MSKKPKKIVYKEEEYPFKKRWLPFQNQIITGFNFYNFNDESGNVVDGYKEFVSKQIIIQNTANTSMDCRVLTVKHLKVDVRVTPLDGVTVNDVWNSVVEVFRLDNLKFADKSMVQIFLQELICCNAYIYYKPTDTKHGINYHKKVDKFIYLKETSLERTHPEWMLACVPIHFDHNGIGHAHLEVDIAKNLRLKENIYVSIAGIVKNNVDWKSLFVENSSIVLDYSYVACV